MTRRRAYLAYRESGMDWLGHVPSHWRVIRLKFAAKLTMGQSPSSDDCNRDGDGPPFLQGNAEFGSHHPSPKLYCTTATKFALPGDVLLSVRAPVGALNIADQRYGIGRGLCAVRPDPRKLDAGYCIYLLQVVGTALGAVATGSTYDAVSIEDVGAVHCVTPSTDEQRAIAKFLDRETAKIDALVARKERQIELLEEKRAALITRAVTKGLDPSVPMKDSGVEWLGMIPRHWEVERLKNHLISLEQGWSPLCENRPAEEDEWGVLKVGCVNETRFDASENKALPRDMEPDASLEIRSGDILMSRANTRELLGSAAIVPQVRRRLLLCDKLYRVRLRPSGMNPQFLVYQFGAATVRYQLEREATGASGSMQNVSQEAIRNIVLTNPPAAEQGVIVSFIEEREATTEVMTFKIRDGILRLREYRAALISAAVTGKIDVREVVAAG